MQTNDQLFKKQISKYKVKSTKSVKFEENIFHLHKYVLQNTL